MKYYGDIDNIFAPNILVKRDIVVCNMKESMDIVDGSYSMTTHIGMPCGNMIAEKRL